MLIDTSPSAETKHELERSTEEIHRLTAIIDRLNLEMVDLRNKNERLMGACKAMDRWVEHNNGEDEELETLTLQTVMEIVRNAMK